MNLIELRKRADDLAQQGTAADPRQVFELRGAWDEAKPSVESSFAHLIEDRVALAESYAEQKTYHVQFTLREVIVISGALSFAGNQVPGSIGRRYAELANEYIEYRTEGVVSVDGDVSAYELVHLSAGLLLADVRQCFTSETLAECRTLADQLQAVLPASTPTVDYTLLYMQADQLAQQAYQDANALNPGTVLSFRVQWDGVRDGASTEHQNLIEHRLLQAEVACTGVQYQIEIEASEKELLLLCLRHAAKHTPGTVGPRFVVLADELQPLAPGSYDLSAYEAAFMHYSLALVAESAQADPEQGYLASTCDELAGQLGAFFAASVGVAA